MRAGPEGASRGCVSAHRASHTHTCAHTSGRIARPLHHVTRSKPRPGRAPRPAAGAQASVRCLAPYGRLLEIGKADVLGGARLPMAPLDRNIAFEGIDLDRLFFDGAAAGQACPAFPKALAADQARASSDWVQGSVMLV